MFVNAPAATITPGAGLVTKLPAMQDEGIAQTGCVQLNSLILFTH